MDRSEPRGVLLCRSCYEPLPDLANPRVRLQFWFQRHRLAAVLLLSVVVVLGLGGYAIYAQAELTRLRHELADELARLEAQHQSEVTTARQEHQETARRAEEQAQARLRADGEAHQAKLRQPDLLSGNLARQRREAEWTRRLNHDPALAVSPMEQTLLKLEQVGRNPQLAAQEALEMVARLAAPPESRVEVTPVDGKFIVKVAFKLSALSPDEQGPWTRHATVESLQRETIALCARVMRALYDACGWRGIRKMQVSCNRAVRRMDIPAAISAEERQARLREAPIVMDVLFRASMGEREAAKVPNWRLLPLHKIADLLVVEINGFPTLTITREAAGTSPRVDPSEPLKF